MNGLILASRSIKGADARRAADGGGTGKGDGND